MALTESFHLFAADMIRQTLLAEEEDDEGAQLARIRRAAASFFCYDLLANIVFSLRR
jgi:hypothetical protein